MQSLLTPFALSLSKGKQCTKIAIDLYPIMVRQAHHERISTIRLIPIHPYSN
jgi:hypothetical protein